MTSPQLQQRFVRVEVWKCYKIVDEHSKQNENRSDDVQNSSPSWCLQPSTKQTITHTHPFNGPFPTIIAGNEAWNRNVFRCWRKVDRDIYSCNNKSSNTTHTVTHTRLTALFRDYPSKAPHHSVFCRPDALPAAQPTVSKHWRQKTDNQVFKKTRTTTLKR